MHTVADAHSAAEGPRDAPPRCEHCVQFYLDGQALVDSLDAYVRQGLDHKAAVVVIASEPHLQALAQRWQEQGFDAAQARGRGRLVLLDAAQTLAPLMVDGAPDRDRFLARMGDLVSRTERQHGHVHLFGEMVALLWKEGRTQAAVRMEQLWNELARTHAFTLFCAYSLQDCVGEHLIEPLEAICASHTRVIAAQGEPSSLSPPQQRRAIALLQRRAYLLEKKLEQETQTQRALAHLAAIVQFSDDAIISKTLDGTIQSWNAAAQRMFGYSAEEAVGRSITLIIPPHRHEEEQHILETLKRGGSIDHFETTRMTKDGRAVEVSLTVSPLRDAAGTIIGASKIARDITARCHADQKLRESERALREANRRKDEFLAMLAHELRNPLAPIGNASEVLSRTVARDGRAHLAIEMIKRQTAQLTRLVDDLLDVSRITQGRIQLRRRPVDLANVIAQAVETVEPQLREKQHKVSITTSYEPLYVDGDSARLVQCVGNILANAVKYTDARGEIRVRTHAEDASAVIEIADAGAGIPPQLLPRIFDLFVQSDRTLDRAQGGLGIGLALVKRLIEMHGGRVTAHSPGLGSGSTFQIRLPRIDSPSATRAVDEQVDVPSRRVLIVDDNIDAADSLALLLSMRGHEAQAVYGSTQAMQRIESFQPDVALLDIGLPEMDGYQLAERLRAIPQLGSTRLVALSGYGQAEDHQRARAAGFDDYRVKPVGIPALDRALAGISGRRD